MLPSLPAVVGGPTPRLHSWYAAVSVEALQISGVAVVVLCLQGSWYQCGKEPGCHRRVLWAQGYPELPGTLALRRSHSWPKIYSADIAWGLQREETVYAYSYVQNTGDASVITVGTQQSCSRKVNGETGNCVISQARQNTHKKGAHSQSAGTFSCLLVLASGTASVLAYTVYDIRCLSTLKAIMKQIQVDSTGHGF